MSASSRVSWVIQTIFGQRFHQFPKANGNRSIANTSCTCIRWRTSAYGGLEYACAVNMGDARGIWEGKEPTAALDALWSVGAGDQISRMIVGALRDCGQIKGTASDVKGDVQVRRVLGRALLGQMTDAEAAVALARCLHPADPWQLDAALWIVCSSFCKTTPACSQCQLAPHCAYALGNVAA